MEQHTGNDHQDPNKPGFPKALRANWLDIQIHALSLCIFLTTQDHCRATGTLNTQHELSCWKSCKNNTSGIGDSYL